MKIANNRNIFLSEIILNKMQKKYKYYRIKLKD